MSPEVRSWTSRNPVKQNASRAVGGVLNWVQGLDLNQRPSGYEGEDDRPFQNFVTKCLRSHRSGFILSFRMFFGCLTCPATDGYGCTPTDRLGEIGLVEPRISFQEPATKARHATGPLRSAALRSGAQAAVVTRSIRPSWINSLCDEARRVDGARDRPSRMSAASQRAGKVLHRPNTDA